MGEFNMSEMDAIRARHSVRSFTDEPIPKGVREALQAEIGRCNGEGACT